MKEVGKLATTGHEEADTRPVIHVKHAAANHPTVIVISEDTDVFVILLGVWMFRNQETDTVEKRKEKSD